MTVSRRLRCDSFLSVGFLEKQPSAANPENAREVGMLAGDINRSATDLESFVIAVTDPYPSSQRASDIFS